MTAHARHLVSATVVQLGPTFVGPDGETPTDPDSTPTVTVTRLSDGSPIVAVVDGVDVGAFTATFTAPATVDELTITWSASVGGVMQRWVGSASVVGSLWATLWDLRQEPTMHDPAKVPGWLITECRDAVTDHVEEVLGFAIGERFGRTHTIAKGASDIPLDQVQVRQILGVSIDGEPQDLDGWIVGPAGVLSAPHPLHGELVVDVEHGVVCPPLLRRPMIATVAHEVAQRAAGAPRNIISLSGADVTTRFSTHDAHRGRPTGWVWLDPALEALRSRAGAIA